MRSMVLTIAAAALFGAAGCGEAEWVEGLDEPGAERAEEVAEEVAEERMEARDVDPLSEEIREEVAGERAELATDVGADPMESIDEEARTAAGHLAEGEGDEYATE